MKKHFAKLVVLAIVIVAAYFAWKKFGPQKFNKNIKSTVKPSVPPGTIVD